MIELSSFVFYLLLSTLACLAMVTFSTLTYVIAIFWGIILIFSGFKLERNQVIIIFLINALLLFGTAGSSTLFFYLAFFGTPAIIMSLLANQQKDYYELQKWGMATAVITVTVFMAALYFSLGDIGVSQLHEEANNYMEESLAWYEESGLIETYEGLGITRDDLISNMETIAYNITRHLPAFYYLEAISAVFLMLLVGVFISNKRQLDYLYKRPYIQEIMPWQLVWVFIAGLALWLIGREEMSTIYYVGSNTIAVLVPIVMYFGLAALLYRIKRTKRNLKFFIIFTLVLITIFVPISVIVFLTLIGLFDALLDYRKIKS